MLSVLFCLPISALVPNYYCGLISSLIAQVLEMAQDITEVYYFNLLSYRHMFIQLKLESPSFFAGRSSLRVYLALQE